MTSGTSSLAVTLCCFQAMMGAVTSSLQPVTSSSGEPISVQQLDDMNDVSSERVTMSQSDAAADRLSLRLSLHSSSLLLNLNRSRFIDDQTPVYVARHGHVVRWTDAPANQSFVVYTDAANQAVVMLQSRVTSSGHVTKNYEGTFRLGNDNYLLTSLSSQRRQTSDDIATTAADNDYVAYRMEARSNNYTDDDVTDDDDEVTQNNDDWTQYSNITSQFPVYVIEVLMVIDYAIYRSWYDLSRERTSVTKSNDAINSIRYYYTQIAAGMDLRFASMQATDFSIKIRFVGIYIATTESDSPWTESGDSRFVVDNVVYVNSGKALDHFQAWITDTAPSLNLPSFDQATLFSGNIVTSSSSSRDNIKRIAGLGNIAGLCSSRSVTVCQEWNQYASVGTATHELGHNLGSYHDGQSNECSSDDQFIMAKSPTVLNDNNFLHAYQFSHCSVTYFRAYLNKLNTQKINCMLNSSAINVSQVDETIVLPPGQFIPIDKQCQLLYGAESFYCAGAINERSVCEKMPCYASEIKQCHARVEQRAANGTTCGNGKWCYKGRCVRNEKAPNAAAYCVYGDSKAPFDDGTTCETKLATSPGLCYHDHYNATCCYTCQQIRSQHSSDCLYGDRDGDYCAQIVSRDCYAEQVRRTCCATCQRYRYYLSDCEYGDRASWCATMTEGAECYDAGKSRTCCFTCNHLRSYGRPGCEYGDRASWCKTYTLQQCKQDSSVQATCCFTCNGTNTQIDTSCRDNADWCPTISPSYCYATDKICCKTCRAYNIHVPGCEYGNRYLWCNSTMTRGDCQQHSNVDDCCLSCYLLANVIRTTPAPSRAASLYVAPCLTATTVSLLALVARWRCIAAISIDLFTVT